MKRLVTIALLVGGCGLVTEAGAQVTQVGSVIRFDSAAQTPTSSGNDVIRNAQPKALPMNPTAPGLQGAATAPNGSSGSAGSAAGQPGSAPAAEVPPAVSSPKQQQSGIAPQEFGTSNHVFTTNRVNTFNGTTVTGYPFRAAGQLFFTEPAGNFVCSASLIKPGILVTAAHCVANYGQQQFYTGWQFQPARNGGSAPYGTINRTRAWILSSYYFGSSNCNVVCPDDVAVIELASRIGDTVGTYGYGWNGWGFNSSNQILISQLGYPCGLDSCTLMQRGDSQGFKGSSSQRDNTIIGSLMDGGSSGGPWLANLGMQPTLGGGIQFGSASNRNIVVGVTSWGFVNQAIKQQGASRFTDANILPLVNAACNTAPSKC